LRVCEQRRDAAEERAASTSPTCRPDRPSTVSAAAAHRAGGGSLRTKLLIMTCGGPRIMEPTAR
jgi:hypothetical protein